MGLGHKRDGKKIALPSYLSRARSGTHLKLAQTDGIRKKEITKSDTKVAQRTN
jgi:hypothetical protein